MVNARESVGRLMKLAVRPRKFATYQKTHDFEYKLSLRCNIQKYFGLKTNECCCKMIIGCKSTNDGFYHTLTSHARVGVSKDSGKRKSIRTRVHGT